jgi:hypothetical protein
MMIQLAQKKKYKIKLSNINVFKKPLFGKSGFGGGPVKPPLAALNYGCASDNPYGMTSGNLFKTSYY